MSDRENVRVALSTAQVKFLEQVEAHAVAAIARRDTVLQTLAAIESMEGSYQFAGIEEHDGQHYLVLAPI